MDEIRRSFFVLDLGGSAWEKTSGYLTSIGYECHRVSFTDTNAKNSCMDPLLMVRLDGKHEELDAGDITAGLQGAKGSRLTENESFFFEYARSGIVAGILFVRLTYPPERQNLPAVASLFTPTAKKSVQQRFDDMVAVKHDPDLKYGYKDEEGNPSPYHPIIRDTFNEFRHMHGDTLKSVVTNIQRYLRPFRTQTISHAMRGLTVPPNRFFDRSKPPVAVFVAVATGSKKSLGGVVRPIIEMYTQAWQTVDREGTDQWVDLVIDEADSWSPIGILRDDAQVLRKHHVNLHVAFQGYNQIYDKYGKYQMIESACAIHEIMTPADDETKDRISKKLGEFTYAIKGPEVNGESNPLERHRLRLKPDEVGRMPDTRALVFRRGYEPAYVYLPFYFKDPVFTERSMIPPPFAVAPDEHELLNDESRDVIDENTTAVLAADDRARLEDMILKAWVA